MAEAPKKISVVFEKRHGPYQPGDRAGFAPAVARKIIKTGKAKLRAPKQDAEIVPDDGSDGADDLREELKKLSRGELDQKALELDLDPSEYGNKGKLVDAVVEQMFERGADVVA